MRLAVVYGGGSSEQDSSYKSAKSIMDSLANRGYSPALMHFDEELYPRLITEKIEFVFIAAQGKKCGDGTLQAILDRLGIGYTGSDMTASAICNDKVACKKLMAAEGILTPCYTTFTVHDDYLQKLRNSVGFPCVVKAPHEGSSYGLDFICSEDEVDKIPPLFAYDDKLLAEERIAGTDLTLPILEDNGVFTFLPLIEICPKNGLNTTFSKFAPGQIEYPPAKVSDEIYAKAKSVSKALFTVVGARGYARVDMILRDSSLYVLEINGVPGLSEQSIFPKAAKIIGMSKDDLIEKILLSCLKGREKSIVNN